MAGDSLGPAGRPGNERFLGGAHRHGNMATETADGLSDHLRGVTVTTLATVTGLLAGVLSAFLASGPKDTLGLSILAGALLAQLPLLYVLGVDPREFGMKDNLYLLFMTFTLWFITWGLLLTTGFPE